MLGLLALCHAAIPPAPSSSAAWMQRSHWIPHNDSERTARFMRLLPSLGLHCPKVGVSTFWYPSIGRRLRGAVALEPIAKHEEVCVVPLANMISFLSVQNSSFAPVLRMADKDVSQRGLWEAAAISLFILREGARDSSPHAAYIHASFSGHDPASIPKTLPPDSDAFRALKPSVQATARRFQARVAALHQRLIAPALQQHPAAFAEGGACDPTAAASADGAASPRSCASLYSLRRVTEVLGVVQARDWNLPVFGRTRQFIVPVCDMLNFGQIGLRVRFDDRRSSFLLWALRPIAAGAELLFYYGSFCQDEALSNYGFVPPVSRPCEGSSKSKHKGSKHKGMP